jgi:hypothetical protein
VPRRCIWRLDLQLGAAFIDLSFDKSGQTALGPRQVAKARALLGDQGDKLTAVGMHSAVYYDLVERKAIDYITNSEARLATAATGASTINAVGGSIAAAYGGDNAVPLYMGLRVIVSDDGAYQHQLSGVFLHPRRYRQR